VDEAEWTRLFADYYPGLVARLTMVLRDRAEAEDVAQEAYLRAFRSRDRFDGANPRAWLHTIGLRLALNEVRRRRRALARLVRVSDSVDPQPSDLDLWDALRGLSPQQRAALLLHLADGYALDETAAILGVPTGTAASWVSRARARLRSELGGDEP
jgi:RNA polymerase sigma-70 factor, ECF subfamily